MVVVVLVLRLLLRFATMLRIVDPDGRNIYVYRVPNGNIKFTMATAINVDTYLLYKRFLEYLSLYTCARLSTFIHTRPFEDC